MIHWNGFDSAFVIVYL